MIYFDNAASTYPKPGSVSKSVDNWLKNNGANPGRSGHKPAMAAGGVVFDTRVLICKLIGMNDPENIVFVPNATYGLNFLIQGILKSGDHAVTTDLEHNSVLRPLKLLEKKGVNFDAVCVDLYDDNKTVENILKSIKKNTKLVICTQCSNVCGKVMPIRKISAALPDGVKLLVDGAQGAGLIPTDMKADGVDYYCAPSHKGLMGPQGSGFIAINNDLFEPLIVGGTGSESFDLDQPDYLPDMLESGTLATPAIVGMYEGIKFVLGLGVENIFQHKVSLVKYAVNALNGLDGVITYVDPELSCFASTTCFNVSNQDSDQVGEYLAENDICVRSGIHCAPLFHKKMGTEKTGMVRISFGCYNTEYEIDQFIKILKKYLKK